MNRSYRILPCYTGDVSGAASALYELGGMVVIHDPSGCNSTYNTHDENRWYDNDSLIFISGLSHREAIFGEDKKFIDDIAEAAEKLNPKFIALTSSPIPFMNGTDFNAIAKIVREKTGILTFIVSTNGMHDYIVGAGNALEAAARYLTSDASDRKQSVSDHSKNRINILGLTPLDFTKDAAFTVKDRLTEAGFEIVSSWSYGCTLQDIQRSHIADVNLVVSAAGYQAALVLKEKYGTPYVCGCPTGLFANIVYDMMKQSATDKKDRIAYKESFEAVPNKSDFSKTGTSGQPEKFLLIGEPIAMSSLASALEMQYGIQTKVACPLELKKINASVLLRDGDILCDGEEEIEAALKNEKYVIADPMYGNILPEGSKLYGLPHLAFSGRGFMWHKENIPDIYSVIDNDELHTIL